MLNELLTGFYNTPPLWKNVQFGLQQFKMPEVDAVTDISIQIPARLRLGHQMEYVFKHLIDLSNKFEVRHNNINVEEGKLRIGELDFILKEKNSNKHLHVELAYKFYIINPEISQPIYRLMGPNKRDMFYTKLDKLKEKQFPLLFHNSLQQYWQPDGIEPSEVLQQCCFKAQLFQPYGQKVSIRPLNTDCITGSWIRFDDFKTSEFQSYEYYIPYKIQWVIAPNENVEWMSHYEILLEVNLRLLKENAPMLWVKPPSGEIKKLFVVWW